MPKCPLFFSRQKLHFQHLSRSSSPNSPKPWLVYMLAPSLFYCLRQSDFLLNSILINFFTHLQFLTPLMFRALVRLLTSLVSQPAAAVTTLLYYSELLPQNSQLERLIRHELLDRENYLLHFLVSFLRCFW